MSNSKILGLSTLALLLCLLTVPTLFLLLPVFLFPLAACLISLYVYRRGLRGQAHSLGIRLFALLPIPVAIFTFLFCMQWIQQGYRA
ncbi:hypothetical protein DUD43_04560 [Alcaligenes faecalis]|uniref:hypothetical protein n=1 Tax=Alcaligenes faecalis TaxID=511 RepID=UPI001293F9CA|nr:hypothetical protein [Alcaligenes faecalis]MBX6965480.1 hypothetical protein [Providencia rettgeri]MBX7030817.1 hypothetical protein [Alcaligenes faecalis]QFY77012.1 hypothetical protein DUD43_04560 [Alcaligenes faecalis]